MAFYSASIDEEGHETKRTYSAGRSSNDCSRKPTPRTFFKTVRYVSSAAYIEKGVDVDDEEQIQSGEMSNTTSSEVVPNLDLTSQESYPSTDNDMWYGKACEISKMITKPDAFQAWLSAKKKSKFYQMMREKAIEEEKEKERAEKKRISEDKYQEWLKKKSSTSVNKKKSPKTSSPPISQARSQEEIDRNFEDWLLKKANYDKVLKEKIKEQLEEKRILEETKKKISEKIYQKWLENAPYKPKPVPLNQGLLSLKGSTTEIYKNPEPWRKVQGDEEEVDDLSAYDEVMRF